jgi:hypothetical protein
MRIPTVETAADRAPGSVTPMILRQYQVMKVVTKRVKSIGLTIERKGVFLGGWGRLGFELRASHLQNKHCTTSPVHFAWLFGDFAWTGLKLQSSGSQPPM